MKKLLVVAFMLVASVAWAELTTTEGETKIIKVIRQVYSTIDQTRNRIADVYAKANVYVTAHPTQFTTADKTKLSGLQSEITDVDTAIASLKTYITTEWPGINE